MAMQENDCPQQATRRGFLKKAATAITGALAALVPTAAGLTVFFDPLRRRSKANSPVRVTNLKNLPNDGVPRKFSVIDQRSDAWNEFPKARVGAVYLRRTDESVVQAFNVACPHAGCFVDYRSERGSFFCPCHNSTFAMDGSIADPSSPSPRGLDSLEVEIRNGNEIWVKFQNFLAGRAEKVPVA